MDRPGLSLPAACVVIAAAAASFGPPSPRGPENLLAAQLEVASASARQSAVAMTAWKNRDPDLFMSTVPADFRLERPDGTVVTWQALHERQKRQMAALRRTDRFLVTIEVASVGLETAVVLSTQDWTRVVAGAEGEDARFRTTVTHRESWKRVGGRWRMESFTEQDPSRERLDDASLEDRRERHEIQMGLTDPAAARP